MAEREMVLLIGRGFQGLGGAIITAVSLSLIVDSHPHAEERTHAIGVYGLVSASGGALGEVLGGVLTQSLHWHCIFLVNVPSGLVIFVVSMLALKPDPKAIALPRLDLWGAIAITLALGSAVSALLDAGVTRWPSLRSPVSLAAFVVFLSSFLIIEIRAADPLIPGRRMAAPNFVVANIIAIFWSAASFSWFVIAALYLQRICGYGSLQIALAFLPATVLMAASSIGLSGKVISRLGARRMLFFGMGLVAFSLMLFAQMPAHAPSTVDVLVPMILLGIGGGAASTPLLMTAMSSVEGRDSGLASGIVNTCFIVGGTLGVAMLGAIAARRTGVLLESGVGAVESFTLGYHAAFWVGALLAAFAAVAAVLLLRPERPSLNP